MLVRSGKHPKFNLHRSLLRTLIAHFRIITAIISTPLTCPINLKCYHSTTSSDSTFGSDLPDPFRYTWSSHNYAYIEDPTRLATRALHHAVHYSDANTPFMLLIAFLKRS